MTKNNYCHENNYSIEEGKVRFELGEFQMTSSAAWTIVDVKPEWLGSRTERRLSWTIKISPFKSPMPLIGRECWLESDVESEGRVFQRMNVYFFCL